MTISITLSKRMLYLGISSVLLLSRTPCTTGNRASFLQKQSVLSSTDDDMSSHIATPRLGLVRSV